jgi:hypothetical protein
MTREGRMLVGQGKRGMVLDLIERHAVIQADPSRGVGGGGIGRPKHGSHCSRHIIMVCDRYGCSHDKEGITRAEKVKIPDLMRIRVSCHLIHHSFIHSF